MHHLAIYDNMIHKFRTYSPVGGEGTCEGPDTRGLSLLLGRPTKATIAVAICWISSTERPARVGLLRSEVVEFSLLCCLVGRRQSRIHDTVNNFTPYDRAVS